MKTTQTTLKRIILVTSTIFAATGLLEAQNLMNGSFELGTNPGSDFIDINAPNSTIVTGWTVSSGSVDYIGGRWAPADGSRSMDLNGSSAGTLTQNVGGFTSGQGYHLYFWMAGSPDAGAGTSRSMQVNIGSVSQIFSAVSTGSSSSPGWTQRSLDFTATSSAMTLSFVSQVSGDWGPLLDEVSIIPVPEPGILSLGAAALGLLAFASKKASPTR